MTGISPPTPASPRAPGRGFWAMRDLPMLLWFVAIVIVAVIHRDLPRPAWLLLHLLFLGAATHAILVWSQHFAAAMLRKPPTLRDRRMQNWRLILVNLGTVAVLVGVLAPVWALTISGAVLVGAAAIWHGASLLRRMRGALPGRFSKTVRYYAAAAACLPIGAGIGAWIAGPGNASGSLTLAHALINVFGWLGLTIAGTLVTLWPTMLRTKADERAAAGSARALPVLGGAVLIASAGAAAGMPLVIAVGLLGYAAGLGLIGVSLWRAARTSPPRSFATLSAAAALMWWVMALGVLIWAAIGAGVADIAAAGIAGVAGSTVADAGVSAVRVALADVGPLLGAGFIAQLLIGALSYLVPVVLGGGPRAVRAGTAVFDRVGTLRVTVANAALLVCVLPVTSLTRVVASILYLAAVASFIPLMLIAMRAQRRAKHAGDDGRRLPMPTVRAPAMHGPAAQSGPAKGIAPEATLGATLERPDREPASHRTAQATAGLIAVALTVAVCASLAPHTLGPVGSVHSAQDGTAAPGVAPDDAPVQTVTVEATEDMRFVPDRIEVPAGTRLVIELTNTDPTQPHDLVLENGAASSRVAPGATETLDAGVLTETLDGWCSIVGHKQMGMVLDIVVTGEAGNAGDAGKPGEAAHGHAGGGSAGGTDAHAGHGSGGTNGGAGASVPLTLSDIDLGADPGPNFEPHEAELPSLEGRGPTTHEVTLRAQEEIAEVAPGVTQRLWTFGDTAPGPTLHGRVGDTFVVTLINDGTIGHSIDFHAGALAPDEPMRTIAPGEELTYTFTAERSGIWLYHCATHPMSAHIANGMFGAVIIEPESLPAVDRSYVLVQSEFFLGPEGGEVDMDKLLADSPDLVVFNGVAAQYQHAPLPARVGERTRVWVLVAGPNRASSFHVIGGQFDTVWAEGRYLVNRATDTGSQALGLQPAQGGFVELVFPEAGHYPFVSHIMVDAERGASGVFRVTE